MTFPRSRRVLVALVAVLSMLTASAAFAHHSPGGDQTPGNARLWNDRPGFATNNAPLGESQFFLSAWQPHFVGNPSAVMRWVNRGTAGVDISGEGIFDTPQTGARYISVFYDNHDCTLGPNREGHLAHVEWQRPACATCGGFAYVGVPDRPGYRIHVNPARILSVSIRRFKPGADFPETAANTVLAACYSFALGTRPVPG